MKKLILMGVALSLTGCATSQEKIARMEQQLAQYKIYAEQARTYDAVAVTGTNLSWSITGATEIRMQSPLDTLAPPERDPTGGELAAQVISGGIPWVAGAIVGHAAMTRKNSTTTIQEQPAEAVEPVPPIVGRRRFIGTGATE